MIVMQVAAGRCDDLASIQARIEEVVIKSIIYTVSTHYLHTIYRSTVGHQLLQYNSDIYIQNRQDLWWQVAN